MQKLEVSSRGELVAMNRPLMTIYSPELLTAQKEFVTSLRPRRRKGQGNPECHQHRRATRGVRQTTIATLEHDGRADFRTGKNAPIKRYAGPALHHSKASCRNAGVEQGRAGEHG